MNYLKALRRERKRPDRELKYFKKPQGPPKGPTPTHSKDGKILFCGKDVTPTPLRDPSFLTYPDGRRAALKKMDVEMQPPASPIIPMEDILASGGYMKYYPEKVIVPPKESFMHKTLHGNQEKVRPEEPQLRRDASLDDLTRDEDEEELECVKRIQATELMEIDDAAIHNIHEFEDLPENKVVLILKETETMFLLEITSAFDDGLEGFEDFAEVGEFTPPEQCEDLQKIVKHKKVSFEKETQTIAPCKVETEMMTMTPSTKDFGANSTNRTIYDDIKEDTDREAECLQAEVERQKKRLYDMLMNPDGHFKNDLPYILFHLRSMDQLMKDLPAERQLDIVLKFIKDYEEDPEIEKIAQELSNDYDNFIKEVKRVRDELYPLAEGVEPFTAEEIENVVERPLPGFEGVIPEDEVKAIIELDEFSSNLPQPSKLTSEDEYSRILKSETFISALHVVENILLYQGQSSKIEKFISLENETEGPGLTEMDFAYSLEMLWEFSDEEAKGQPLSCIAWCEECAGLFAAGYGKWEYKNNLTCSGPGLLLIWSVALPRERPICRLTLNAPVVSIRFHPDTICCIAIGLSSGDIVLADVNEQMTTVSSIVKLRLENSYGPAYALSWFRGVGDEERDMYLVTGGRKGALFRWNSSKGFLISEKILTLPPIYGRMKGIKITDPDNELPLALNPNPIATCIEHHHKVSNEPIVLDEQPTKEEEPSSHLYLVATDNGCVHQCSLEYMHHHIDFFRAHDGPVNSLSFNYFIDRIFLTCGADWTVRIWALDVKPPLITLQHEMECVECAVWSRHYPTIIASISGKTLYIWDLERRASYPVSTLVNPKMHKFTSLSFSVDGQNILTGDMDGNLCVYNMEELPFVPKFPVKSLIAAIKKALINQPNTLTELEDTGPPFKEEQE